ncbi:MAG: acyl-CoA thioester hydrolase/BAAT C-terminal domain-containing protein [Burkholderiales bacterium]
MRFIGRLLLVLFLLIIVGLVAVYVLEPFAPAVQISDPAPEGIRISENGLLANYYPGKGEGQHAGIMLLGGSEGGLGAGVTRMAKSLQENGFSVLHVSYFRAPGQLKRLEFVPLELFDRALEWLKARPDVDGTRLAVMGGSKGAEAALIIATRHPELLAAVAGMPSSVAWSGIDWNFMNYFIDPPGGSWSLGGKAIPYLPITGEYASKLSDLYEQSLKHLPAHPDAVIPIERGKARVLLICGEMDTLWPSCPMARQVEERAVRFGVPQVTLLAYAQAGHAVMGLPIDRAEPRFDSLDSLGGTDEGNNAAREDGWPKIVAHLKSALASQ